MRGGKLRRAGSKAKKPSAIGKSIAGNRLGRRRLIIVSGLVLLLVIGAFSWLAMRTSQSTTYSGPTEKIRLGNIGEYSVFDLIAKDKGYFKDNGLDAQIVPYTSGPPAMDGLLAGQVDVMVAADFVGVRYLFANPNIRILTQASKHQVFRMIALKDKDISSPADLAGKSIGVTKKSAGEFYLGRFLTFNDLPPTAITTVDLPPADMISRLKAGTLDAVVIFDPHAYDLEKALGDRQVSWPVQGTQKTLALAYGTAEFISKHPGVVDRYLRSLLMAEDYINNHPGETRQLMSRLLGYDLAYVDHMLEENTFIHGLDQSLLLTLEDQARWLIDNQLNGQSVPNYLDYIYFDGLNHVKPEAITIIR